MARRSRFDALAPVDAPRWLNVLTLARECLASRQLAPLADLGGELATEVDRMRAKGWQPECDGRYGFVFMRRGGERLQIDLSVYAPGGGLTGGLSF